jgi:hypothetical protein
MTGFKLNSQIWLSRIRKIRSCKKKTMERIRIQSRKLEYGYKGKRLRDKKIV